MKKVLILLFMGSFLIADDKSDIEEVIHDHWLFWGANNFKDYISTIHSKGTMNGDSNGSFWFRQESTVSAITANGWGSPSNKFDFKPKYIEVDVLEKDKIAIAYYYLVGSYTINGKSKSDYRTRVSQVFVKEGGNWKVKSGHFTQLHGGSGIPN